MDGNKKEQSPQDGAESKRQLAARTLRDYQDLLKTMERAAHRKRWNGVEDEQPVITDQHLIEDLLLNENELRFSTLRRRRDALVHFLRESPTRGYSACGQMIEEISSSSFTKRLREVAFPDKSPKPSPNNSRQTKRIIPENDYKLLIEAIAEMRKPTRNALIFLQATVATGARPIEWINAVWEDRLQGKLKLKNAKQKSRNGLSNKSFVPNVIFKEGSEPEYRIVHVDSQDIEVVDKHLLSVRSYLLSRNEFGFELDHMPDEIKAEVFKKYYDRCRLVYHRACKKLFPDGRLYSLYDARNVFAANRRARDGMKITAAQLGHNSENISTRIAAFYGNRYMAWSAYKHGSISQQITQNHAENPEQIPVRFNLQSLKP